MKVGKAVKTAKAKVVSKVVQEVQTEQTAVVLSKDDLAIVNEFFETRTMVNQLSKTQKELEALVKEILGDAEVGVVNGKVRIERETRSKNYLDPKKLKSAFPEAFDTCSEDRPYVVLVAK
jgi:predicted phage-related endonuclease